MKNTEKKTDIEIAKKILFCSQDKFYQWDIIHTRPLLLTWFNFNPVLDKQNNMPSKM